MKVILRHAHKRNKEKIEHITSSNIMVHNLSKLNALNWEVDSPIEKTSSWNMLEFTTDSATNDEPDKKDKINRMTEYLSIH